MTDLIRTSLYIMAFLVFTPTKSQDYIPLAVEGVHWIVAYNHIDSPWTVDDLWEYYAEGDTIIEGEMFIKVYKRDLEITQDPPPFMPIGDYELQGFIRDDTTERKVYAIDLDSWDKFCPSQEEFLMFDFSVQTGDSVNFCLIPDFNSWIIDTIYSGTYFGFETRFYNFLGGEGIYEGLGSTYGLFEPMFTPLKKSNQKYIFYTFLYYYCRESPCDLIVSVPENESGLDFFNIFPNPTDGLLNLNLSSAESAGEIIIYNVLGQEMGTIETSPGIIEYQYDMSAFPPGNYVITFISNNTVLERKKFVLTDF